MPKVFTIPFRKRHKTLTSSKKHLNENNAQQSRMARVQTPSSLLPLHESSRNRIIPSPLKNMTATKNLSRKRSYDDCLSAATPKLPSVDHPAEPSTSLESNNENARPRHSKQAFSVTEQPQSKRARHDDSQPGKPSALTEPRVSRFLEDVMSDGLSNEPPVQYVQPSSRAQTDASSTASSTPKRSSGFFRFGKSVATAFSSVFSWKGDDASSAHSSQRDDVWRAYQELKRKGNKSDASVDMITSTTTPSTSTSLLTESKRSSKSSWATEQTQDSSARRSAEVSDPRPPASTIRSSLLHFKKPSLSNLRKAKSELHLRPTDPSPLPPIPTVPYSSTSAIESPNPPPPVPNLHKSASRKDLSRQHKLTKKVSDLESKLDLARRELEEALGGEVPPVPHVDAALYEARETQRGGRGGFVPGLPSLPSERVLRSASRVEQSVREEDAADVEMQNELSMTPPPKFQAEPTTTSTPPAPPPPSTAKLITKGHLPLYSPPPASRTQSMTSNSTPKSNPNSKKKPSRIPRRSISPSEPTLASNGVLPGLVEEGAEDEESMRISPHDEVPPVPALPVGLAALKGGRELSKRVPRVAVDQGVVGMDVDEEGDREEWVWDDDIF
ncbi:MAG: hypothetical protein M1814_005904 [Vezdaea aestivalis]|nr:MAG: hypothetical protein M1814_005904 [Vezdaea aestivalis]